MRPSLIGVEGAWKRAAALALRSPLVLAMDFDGTLAPLVAQPSRARMPQRVARLLQRLAAMDAVVVAVLSGRSLPDLRKRCRIRGANLVGAHGMRSNVPGVGISAGQERRWRSVLRKAKEQIQALPLARRGVRLEDKGLGLALHLRRATPATRRQWRRHLGAIARGLPLQLRGGHDIFELRPRASWDKGRALSALSTRCAPGWRSRGSCIFVGDDDTDEDAFKALRRLGPNCLGVKIGPGKTLAQARLDDPSRFWSLLSQIYDLRSKTQQQRTP